MGIPVPLAAALLFTWRIHPGFGAFDAQSLALGALHPFDRAVAERARPFLINPHGYRWDETTGSSLVKIDVDRKRWAMRDAHRRGTSAEQASITMLNSG